MRKVLGSFASTAETGCGSTYLYSQRSGDRVRRSRRVILSYTARWGIAWNNWETLPGEIEKGERGRKRGGEGEKIKRRKH